MNHLNGKRHLCSGEYCFPEAMEVPIQNWQNDARRDEHACIPENIDGSFPLAVIIEEFCKRDQVDPDRLNAARVDDQRLHLTVDRKKRIKDKEVIFLDMLKFVYDSPKFEFFKKEDIYAFDNYENF